MKKINIVMRIAFKGNCGIKRDQPDNISLKISIKETGNYTDNSTQIKFPVFQKNTVPLILVLPSALRLLGFEGKGMTRKIAAQIELLKKNK